MKNVIWQSESKLNGLTATFKLLSCLTRGLGSNFCVPYFISKLSKMGAATNWDLYIKIVCKVWIYGFQPCTAWRPSEVPEGWLLICKIRYFVNIDFHGIYSTNGIHLLHFLQNLCSTYSWQSFVIVSVYNWILVDNHDVTL